MSEKKKKQSQPKSVDPGLNKIVQVFQNLQVIEFFKTLISSPTQSSKPLSSASALGTPINSGLNQNITEGHTLSQVTQAQDRTSYKGLLGYLKQNQDDFGDTNNLKDLIQDYEKKY